METTKTIVRSPQTGDQYVHIHHKSGLEILVCEMEGFSTTEAMFGTKYGSINTQFKTAADTDYCTVPEGIAHFLEHKLFENEDCDVFDLYAKTGADANAFTSFDKTCYYFDCSDNFKASLEILLSFVQSPYFTPESVAKEQGIIGQEIRMCDDDPGWRVFFNMLGGLYQKHPVRIDIAGTIESIAQITDDLLYRCYRTFYNLHNMVLAVAGNCTVDEVLEVADRLLKPCEDQKLETVFPTESLDIVRSETVETAAVGQPLFHIGFKCAPKTGAENLQAQIEAHIAMRVLAGTSSPLYQELLQEGLINPTFSTEIFNGDGFFTVIFGGESRDPRAVRDRIAAALTNAQETGLDESLFNEFKKSTYGALVRELNNVSSVTNSMIASHMAGYGLYDTLRVLSELKLEDCNRFLRQEMDINRMTLSIIEPAN
ncbi:EF-P 5-aminopentanol modification-associated protein YfmH [uncultured Ruminococcus sp.]|uniref:EF-P 5-aminopentanol modification-associated protein YfmH n=1 Tax=uncultured Ruminococcus sp. TaxID=165186 RepID=UPI00261BF4BC|nr:pitrilysin family protein [uncultured Ruminococcus sp.]